MRSRLWKRLIVCVLALTTGAPDVLACGCGRYFGGYSAYGYGFGNGPIGYAPMGGLGAPAPIPLASPAPTVMAPIASTAVTFREPPSLSCDESLRNAVESFRLENYAKALYWAIRAHEQCPQDANIQEFQALVLFAQEDYAKSASIVHSVLAAGPGWNWAHMWETYQGVTAYTQHIRVMETYAREHPKDGNSRFLLVYHYLLCGHPDAAERQLNQLIKLTPVDPVIDGMIKKIAKLKIRSLPAPAEPPTPVEPK